MFGRRRKRRYEHTIDAGRPAIVDADLVFLRCLARTLQNVAAELLAFCDRLAGY